MFTDTTTRKLADYAASLSYADISPAAVHAAKRCMIDALGCAFGALDAKPIQALCRMASEITSRRPSTLIGQSIKTSPEMAAFINGSAIRYSDFSDDYFGTGGKQAGPHPSDNIGSVLAAGEISDIDGKRLIVGLVLAYEICGRLVDRMSLHPQGWDYPIFHSIASALATGNILRLSEDQISHSLSLAIVPNICLWQTRLGELSNWKAMAGPNGSRNGFFATLLAQQGITGPDGAFEGDAGLKKQLHSPFEIQELGGGTIPYKIVRTYFKYLPIMYSIQLFVGAALELRKKINSAEIKELKIYVSAYHLTIGAFNPERANPKTRETADHSAPFLIAAALIQGAISIKTFDPECLSDPEILALASKVKVHEDPSYTEIYPEMWKCRIEGILYSGVKVAAGHSYPKGHPNNPMSDEEIEQKFMGQTEAVLGKERSRSIINEVWGLEELPRVSRLISMIG